MFTPESVPAVASVLAAAVLLAGATVAVVPATGESAAEATANAEPEIVAVYPNPAVDGDAGEFVVVQFPAPTNVSDWRLADGESNVSLPDATVSGRVVLSPDPNVARNRTDDRVLALAGDVSLANGGETVRLLGGDAGGRTVSSAAYEDAPEGDRWNRVRTDGERSGRGADDSGENRRGRRTAVPEGRWRWTPLGATDFEVNRTGPANVTAFLLPDAPEVPVETLRRADRRVLLAGYTFTSSRAADALAAATRRGVEVRVLVDSDPVGGMTRRQAKLLDSLVARGVAVRVLGGRLARYDFHHAKYAVADDRALVLTENWKPAGTGGRSSRGWGAVVRAEATADRLAAVFDADWGWRGATPWSTFRRGRTFEAADSPPATGSYPADVPPGDVNASSTSVLVAPDNAEDALVSMLDAADDSVRVQQVTVGSRRTRLLRATLRAARRGVRVRILLSSAWYVEEDNRKLAEWLNGMAAEEDLPLEARVADPRGRYEKIHAKGVVVDGEAVAVGSLNWNNHSARANREVAVVLRGREAGRYYADAFDGDWKASAGGREGGSRVPVGLLAAVALGAIAALLVAKREVVFDR